MKTETLLDRGLPCNIDAERVVLGAILLDGQQYELVAGTLEPDAFSLESHRRIFRCMGELQGRGERIDSITVANELRKSNELESSGGLGCLVSLDDGLPYIPNLDSYVRILQEKARPSTELLSPEQVSAIIGASPATLMNWRSQKIGPPFVKLGRKVFYKSESLNAWIDSKEQQTNGTSQPRREMALQVLRSRTNLDRRHRLGGHRTQSQRRADGGSGGAEAGEGWPRRPTEGDHQAIQ